MICNLGGWHLNTFSKEQWTFRQSKRNIAPCHLHAESKRKKNKWTKKWYKWTSLQNGKRQTERRSLWLAWGKGGRAGIIRKFGIDMYTLLYLKWVINKDLLYSTETLLNIMQQPKGGKNLKKSRYRYMYNGITLLYSWDEHSIVK